MGPLWHCRKDAPVVDAFQGGTHPSLGGTHRMGKDPLKAEEAAVGAANRPENFLARPYKRARCKSRREKDRARLNFRLERQRLFKEAFHDNIDSIGEVDALTRSEALNVDRADVLRDPKLSGYQHPALAVKWQYVGPKIERHKAA